MRPFTLTQPHQLCACVSMRSAREGSGIRCTNLLNGESVGEKGGAQKEELKKEKKSIGFIASKRSKNFKRASPPSATGKETVRPRSLACACAAPTSRTDLVARSELDLSLRVADQRARTRWPFRTTFDVRRRSPVGSCNRVACVGSVTFYPSNRLPTLLPTAYYG